MTFALYANTVSPHQLPLAREIVGCLGAENYRYIYTDQLPPERVNLGWGDAGAPWLMQYSSPGAAAWLRDADVVMMQHHRDWNLLEDRLSRGKTCLYPSERWFKPRLGMIRLLWPRYFMMARRFVRMLEKYDRLLYLPQGIHAARDMARLCGLMHGDLRCLFRAPRLEFERQPGGRIFLTQSSREAEKQRGSKYCLEKMRMWGYFVEKSLVDGRQSLVAGFLSGEEFRRRAEEKIEEWLDGVSEKKFITALNLLMNAKLATGEYRLRKYDERELLLNGAIRFFNEFSRKIVQLSDGRCVYFAPDGRSKERNQDNAFSWAEYAVHAVTSSGRLLDGKTYRERLYNHEKASSLYKLEEVIRTEACMYRLIDAHPENDAVLFVGANQMGARMEIVTRLDSFGNADANLAEVTVVATHKRKKKIPPSANRRPLAEVVETVAKHQAAGFSPSTTTSIVSKLGAARKGEGAADSHQSLAAGCLPGEDAVKFTTPPLLLSSTLKVLWVGRLLNLKRVDTIIRAVGELAVSSRNRRLSVARDSSEPSRAQASAERLAVSEASTRATRSTRLNISLDIYGSGPEEARLKKLAAKYGDVIKFHSPVPIGEVRGLMREHDVYVLSSNGYEGWGAVVSEALEEGMKVLGTYEAGSSATMLPESHLFHAGDWHTLAEFLCKAANGELKPTGIGEWSAEKAAEWLLAVSG